MDYAKKLLNKYGWKEGDGLGKHSDGIAKPLKASLKFDHVGLGADQAASDFNNHWWERVFNEAAGNVEVKEGKDGGVSMDVKDSENSVEISTKGYSLKKLKKAKAERGGANDKYDNFLQTATLTQAGDEVENTDKIAVADIAVTQYKTLTDEELFRACGGRTAHKGARHGLKLNGKLARLERQEQEMIANMQKKSQAAPAEDVIPKLKKKKSKCEVTVDQDVLTEEPRRVEVSQDVIDVENCKTEDNQELKKKKKKSKRRHMEDLPVAANSGDCSEQEIPKKKKRKHDRKEVEPLTNEIEISKKCKKKKKQKE